MPLSARTWRWWPLVAGLAAIAATIWVQHHRSVPGRIASHRLPPVGLRAGPPAWAGDPDGESGRIAGRVESADHRPIDGALVAIVPQVEELEPDARLQPAATAPSAGGGRFAVGGLRPGAYLVTATAAGHRAALQRDVALPPAGTAELVLVLGSGGITVTGHVADRGGGAIGHAQVRLLDDPSTLYQVVADDAGAFRITVPAGAYLAVADAEGYAAAQRLVDTAVDARLDFALEPAALLGGRVVRRGSGTSVAGAAVVLGDDLSWWMGRHESTTGADGRFELRNLEPGSYALSAHKDDLAASAPRPVELAAADRRTDVVLELDAGAAISGRVLGEGGAPVGGARLRLTPASARVGQVRATSGADGRYRIEGLLPGRYLLAAEDGAHAPASRELRLSGGETLTGIDLTLATASVIIGKVVAGDGGPVAGATVVAYDRSRQRQRELATDRTDASGAFRLRSLPAGLLQLVAQHPSHGRATHDPEPIGAGETRTVTLTLLPWATISGTVRWQDGAPATGVTVSGISFTQHGGSHARTSADGSYELPGLPAGELVVSASRGGTSVQGALPQGTRELTVTAGEHRSGVDLRLSRGGHRLAGVVLGPDGKPLAGVQVGAYGEDQGSAMMVGLAVGGSALPQTDEAGRFLLEDIDGRPQAVWARRRGFLETRVGGVAPDSMNLRLQLRREAVLSGTVVDERGQPVEEFQVIATPAQPRLPRTTADLMRSSAIHAAHQEVSDPAGAFELHELDEGTFDLRVTTADGRLVEPPAITLAAGERRSGLRLVARAGVVVRGTLVDFLTGAPVASVQVTIAGEDHRGTAVATSVDGSFRVGGLTPGRKITVTFSADEAGFVPERFATELPGRGGDLDLGTLKVVPAHGEDPPGPGKVGLRLQPRPGPPVVEAVVPGGPAAEAGLRPGQLVTSIDGRSTDGLLPAAVLYLVTGPVGTSVRLGIGNPGAGTGGTVTLVRRALGP
jgi:protocatechuate 3,4-dioxygenase beta subunit